jgi:hypothetical protein
MDVSNIPEVASTLAAQKTADQVDIAVLRKALDSQDALAAGLLEAVPPAPALNTSSMGHTIDTMA